MPLILTKYKKTFPLYPSRDTVLCKAYFTWTLTGRRAKDAVEIWWHAAPVAWTHEYFAGLIHAAFTTPICKPQAHSVSS
jgi:hypothetical protein